ncbi:MAG: response regulator [Cyanothece sp. SIO2G6]|nr:response regulator [Cyanothece sp. SIO2G6]
MKKILVVDDVKSEQKLVSDYLKKAGYIVATADGGAEALEKVKADRPDIIVTDLVMPEITGLELCRLLKKEPETADIPIIAFTTKDRNMDKVWARKQGMAAYVTKPCTSDQIIDAVRSVGV